jgi:uncharacterized protein
VHYVDVDAVGIGKVQLSTGDVFGGLVVLNRQLLPSPVLAFFNRHASAPRAETCRSLQQLRRDALCCYYLFMALDCSESEVRVLGCLVEKEITTPEYYPLSLNALMNACNQKSNREPVLSLDEVSIRQAIRGLSDQAFVRSPGGDSRVAKYEHRLNELYNFHRHEIAVLCVLLLRGPQTPGELRIRAERMHEFADLEAVHSALNLLMRRQPPLVKILPRQPGTKESRYMHLFGGENPLRSQSEMEAPMNASSGEADSAAADRIAQLELEVRALRSELETLREQFDRFQKQFQ